MALPSIGELRDDMDIVFGVMAFGIDPINRGGHRSDGAFMMIDLKWQAKDGAEKVVGDDGANLICGETMFDSKASRAAFGVIQGGSDPGFKWCQAVVIVEPFTAFLKALLQSFIGTERIGRGATTFDVIHGCSPFL